MKQNKENELQAELELSLLQINQLQEELEYYYQEYNQLKNTTDEIHPTYQASGLPVLNLLRKARLSDDKYTQSTIFSHNKKQQNEIKSLNKKIEELTLKNQQIESLNIQLENKDTELNQLKEKLNIAQSNEKNNQIDIDTNNKLIAEIEALRTVQQEQAADNELLNLQINQLQEELEVTFIDKQNVEMQLQSASENNQTDIDSNNKLIAKIEALRTVQQEQAADNELPNLQINQLQEELEVTYIDKQNIESQFQFATKNIEQLQASKEDLILTLDKLNATLELKDSEIVEKISSMAHENGLLTDEVSKLGEELSQANDKLISYEVEHKILKVQLDEKQVQLDIATTNNDKLTVQVNELTTQEERKEAESAELTNQLSQARAKLNDYQKSAESLTSEMTSKIGDVVTLNEEVEILKAELVEKSQSLMLGQKMLAKAHVDLDDLRTKYAEKQISETELINLVKELREKLTLASNYYFKLQQEHPELLTSVEDNKG